MKIGRKTYEQKEVINNLNKFYNSREEVIYSLYQSKQITKKVYNNT